MASSLLAIILALTTSKVTRSHITLASPVHCVMLTELHTGRLDSKLWACCEVGRCLQGQLPRPQRPTTNFVSYAPSENVSRNDGAYDIPLADLADERSTPFDPEQVRFACALRATWQHRTCARRCRAFALV